jgi:hypothetical protein
MTDIPGRSDQELAELLAARGLPYHWAPDGELLLEPATVLFLAELVRARDPGRADAVEQLLRRGLAGLLHGGAEWTSLDVSEN